MIKEFKAFILRGNVLDLAVGVVIGSAFTAIVTKVVDGVITPLVGLIVSTLTGGNDLESSLSILDWQPVKGVTFAFGEVISAVITFMITGFVLFLIIKTTNKLKKPVASEETVPTSEAYLKEIRDLLEKQLRP